MAEGTIQKKRKANFSPEELEIMLEEIKKNRVLLQGKFSDTITNEKKKKVWSSIAVKTSVVSKGGCRTNDDNKKKWQDWSSLVKSKRSKIQRKRQRTGGGPPPEEDLNHLEQKVTDILGSTVLDGVDGGIDTAYVWIEKGNEISVDLECREDLNDLDANSDSNPDDENIEKMWDDKIKATIARHISERKQDEKKHGEKSENNQEMPKKKVKTLARSKQVNNAQLSDDTEFITKSVVDIEKVRLSIEKNGLEIEKERLEIDHKRLKTEDKIVEYLEIISKSKCVTCTCVQQMQSATTEESQNLDNTDSDPPPLYTIEYLDL